MSSEPEFRRGIADGVVAYLLWGLFPLYWPLLEPASAIEILAHRIIWSLVLVAALLGVTHGWAATRTAIADTRRSRLLALAAIVVTVNWGTYIWGVNSHHVVETSLGYFINPLLTVLLGVIVLGETLRRAQWVAVVIASVAIVVLTVDYGRLPWIALVLATSFALYGFLKKRAGVGAVESLAIETGVLAIPALITLAIITARGQLVFGSHGAGNTALLVGTGAVTAIPLLFFGAAMRRLPLSVVGLLQYLAPVLQFAVGVGIRHEPLPPARLAGFALVWLALLILTVDGLRSQRRAPAPAPAVESTAV